jgi:hypothetical protein
MGWCLKIEIFYPHYQGSMYLINKDLQKISSIIIKYMEMDNCQCHKIHASRNGAIIQEEDMQIIFATFDFVTTIALRF